MALLDFNNVTKYFGGLTAVNNLTFSLGNQEIVGLIGPNGAGKTTVFNLITGVMKPNSGRIIFNNIDITHLAPHKICQKGIARTFQMVRTFNRLNVLDNIVAGRAFGSMPSPSMKHARLEAEYFLELAGLVNKRFSAAASLGLVDRKRLEIARALATKPKLLLLDEMFAGLNSTEMDDALLLLNTIRSTGISLIVIEHVMKVIMGISDRVIVLKVGEKIAEGLPGEIAENKEVREAYLGKQIIC